MENQRRRAERIPKRERQRTTLCNELFAFHVIKQVNAVTMEYVEHSYFMHGTKQSLVRRGRAFVEMCMVR